MLETLLQHYILSSLSILLIIAILVILGESIYSIGPTQVGLVPKRFGDKLPSDNPVAFRGEAGYQAELAGDIASRLGGFADIEAIENAAAPPVIRAQGTAQADVIRAQGLAKAEGFRAQNEAIGATSTTLVNIATVLAEKGAQFMPQILAVGGGSSIDGLAATLTMVLAGQANLLSPPSLTTGPEKTQG
jgi:regulator of protease activity HflC (stomatin/prohibitin superfamily)